MYILHIVDKCKYTATYICYIIYVYLYQRYEIYIMIQYCDNICLYLNDTYMRYNVKNNILTYVFASDCISPNTLLNLYKCQHIPKP